MLNYIPSSTAIFFVGCVFSAFSSPSTSNNCRFVLLCAGETPLDNEDDEEDGEDVVAWEGAGELMDVLICRNSCNEQKERKTIVVSSISAKRDWLKLAYFKTRKEKTEKEKTEKEK
jgi:hypothetical protein